ncbi:MAG: hypothetical protein ABW133_24485 [Polyangiaceae bacterium]
MSALPAGIVGLFGRPYVDLEPFLDLEPLGAIHDEVCLALAELPSTYTGGSHRSMGIMPESRRGEALVDYGEAIAAMSDRDFATFRSLADDPSAIDVERRRELTFGEEREVPLSRRQMLWLKVRFGVYFPWKVFVELIPSRSWSDKAEPKEFTSRAKSFFPKTVEFARKLPFSHIGRCNIMGLEAHDHGTVHRDGVPEERRVAGLAPDHFIVLCPAANKRLYLFSDVSGEKFTIDKRAYWFNDNDYHGVASAPFFRYSIRVDGVFEETFLRRIQS